MMTSGGGEWEQIKILLSKNLAYMPNSPGNIPLQYTLRSHKSTSDKMTQEETKKSSKK